MISANDPNPEQEFLRCLAETIAWCRPRIDPSNPQFCLRSEELKPRQAQAQPDEANDWGYISDSHCIEEVVQKRKIHQSNIDLASPFSFGGRLIVTACAYSLFDGASATETDLWLDYWDLPPWDTWVCEVEGILHNDGVGKRGGSWPPQLNAIGGNPFRRGLLISWVPPEFVEMVEWGLPMSWAISWVDTPSDSDPNGPRYSIVLPSFLQRIARQMSNLTTNPSQE